MESRKIQLVGNRSYAVSLPKNWVTSNSLKEQHNVFFEQVDGKLIIHPGLQEKQEEKSISVSLDKVENVPEFLMFCYYKNLDKITMNFGKRDHTKIRNVMNIIKHLDGYDITHEDENKVVVSFMFEYANINVQKILNRMVYLLKMLISSAVNDDKETLTEAECSIDKLYHLSKRIIFACVRNSKMRAESGIYRDEDMFFYKDILKKIESIGDIIFENEIDEESKREMIAYTNFLNDLLVHKKSCEMMKKRLDAFKMSKCYFVKLVHELCIDILENAMSLEFNTKYF